MNKIREFTQLVLAFVIVGCFIAVIVLVADGLGAWDILTAQQQARAAEARARELEAQAVVLRERQAMLQTAIMAFASTKDSLLVTVSYITGGMMLFMSAIAIGLLLLERRNHDRDL